MRALSIEKYGILYLILTATPVAHEIFCVYKTMQNMKLFKFCGLLGTQWCSLLRHCATSRKVAGSILDGFTGIFFIDITLPAAL